MNKIYTTIALLFSVVCLHAQTAERIYPSSTEVVKPIHKNNFNNDNTCPERKQGGNPQMVNGYLVFNGSMDGNRQVDPQVAVGGGYVMEGTNSGLIVYDKKGNYVQGVKQSCFNNGIDPKLCFDMHNQVFIFDLWWYYDKPKTKPVNIAVSETNNPLSAWNVYPVSRTAEVDGGGIGYSKKWIGYSYPGGAENTFVLKTSEAKAGKDATVYHFKGSLGHPVFMQDAIDDLYFFSIEDEKFVIKKVVEDENGIPYVVEVSSKPHQLQYIDYPPPSSQFGTTQKVSSGDRNPKNLVFQSGHIWFSQAVNCEGRSAVQWHQINAKTGAIVQSGIIRSDTTNYIQTTIAVNKRKDVLIGFQEVSEKSFISPRFVYRNAKDAKNTVRPIVSVGQGKGATDGQSWGDYSGSIIDGDNLTDLWTIQSITNDKGKGETVIVKVPFKK